IAIADNLQLMQIIGDRNVRVVPDVAVSGNSQGAGLVDGLLGMLLWNQTGKQNGAKKPPAPPAGTVNSSPPPPPPPSLEPPPPIATQPMINAQTLPRTTTKSSHKTEADPFGDLDNFDIS
ncbi:MAG TPA: hypothetical protein DCL61_01510, partial [Cyanobacteria bacterium UBA12227]|nr:hypothetical protein [Cyanobacteria bacterium UBA12227]